jgi:hypothetical protein
MNIGVTCGISKIPCAVNLYHSNYHMYVVVFYPHGGYSSQLGSWLVGLLYEMWYLIS